MNDHQEPNPNEAGTYIVENGVRRLVTPVTADHPEGNAPRPAEDDAGADDAAAGQAADAERAAPRKSLAARVADKLKGGEQ